MARGTRDVVGSIAYDRNATIATACLTMMCLGSGECGFGDVVAMGMLVTETTVSEMLPQFVVSQFCFGPQGDIAGEQAHTNFAMGVQAVDQSTDSRQHLSTTAGQFGAKLLDISLAEPGKLICRWFDAVASHQVGGDGPIAPPGKGNVGGNSLNTKKRAKAGGKGLLTCSTRGDERAVDVEKTNSHVTIVGGPLANARLVLPK